MSAKEMVFRDEARFAILRGVTELARAVKVTLGPKGRHAILGKKWGPPLITKDGVTVAQELDLPDPYENMGAQLVREVASKTSEATGDGTTTATVLAEAIFREGVKNVVAGASATELKRGIDQAVTVVVAELTALSKPCQSQHDIARIGTISANGDPVIGDIIAEAMEQVGKDGVITVEESTGLSTSLEVVEGMRFDRGYISPSFVTDSERMEVILENPCIFICEKTLSTVDHLLSLLEQVAQHHKPLVIIAEDVVGEALVALIMNTRRGALRAAAVKTPGFGESRRAMLQDLAILTGGQAFTEDRGIAIQAVKVTDLGRAKRVKIDRNQTTIIEGAGNPQMIDTRLNHINAQLAKSTPGNDRERLQERQAKLRGGVAVIRIGAATDTEMKEKKARLEDALHATKAAVEEGIVPGGGIALLRCIPALESLMLPGDQQVGVAIVRQALEEPLRQIANNAGHPGSVVLNRLRNEKCSIGFDADKETDSDMLAAGIIDPTKVTRSALSFAASIAGLMLTTEVMVTDRPVEKTGFENVRPDEHHSGLQQV
ncbi:chaperonin GroEL [Nitrospira sp. T9]|uniref:chaperonin GroEL n=1 Tax=unclassified Nitrospira TaxID=2652172 RepID=UPI003F98C75F